MSNRRRLRAPSRSNSRIRADVELAEHLGMGVHRLRESATATLDRPAGQAATLVEAGTAPLRATDGVRRYRARLIAADVQGSTGWYGSDMLREAARARVFATGLPIYADHPTETEEAERPERSIRDLAGRLVTDAICESDGLYADIEVYPMFAPLVEAMADTIGLSIRARGTVEEGKPTGQRGPLVTSIIAAESVDFVTAAGAGGKLVSLLESARTVRLAEARNIEAWFEARIHTDFTQTADGMYGDGRLTREERITLSSAVGDALAAFTARLQADAPQLAARDPYSEAPAADGTLTEAQRLQEATSEETRQALCAAITDAYGDDGNSYVWVRDYDADKGLVWYDAPDGGEPQTWQQAYTATGTPLAVALTDTRTEVVARTVYDPAPSDAEDIAEEDAGVQEADREIAEAATPDVTDGAPPTAPNPSEEETGMSGNQNTGPAPGAAGTSDTTAVSAAVTEAQTARTAAEQALAESTSLAEAATRRATAAEAELARFRAAETARPIVSALLAESQVDTPRAQARVMAQVASQVPLTEAGVLDEAALRTATAAVITEAEADLAEARQTAGAGRVTGFGSNAAGNAAATAEDRLAARARRFRESGMTEAAAKVAAIGGRR